MDENKKLCLNSGEIIASWPVQTLAVSEGLGFDGCVEDHGDSCRR